MEILRFAQNDRKIDMNLNRIGGVLEKHLKNGVF